MKRVLSLAALLVLATGILLGHGSEEHIMGKVTKVTDKSITAVSDVPARGRGFSFGSP